MDQISTGRDSALPQNERESGASVQPGAGRRVRESRDGNETQPSRKPKEWGKMKPLRHTRTPVWVVMAMGLLLPCQQQPLLCVCSHPASACLPALTVCVAEPRKPENYKWSEIRPDTLCLENRGRIKKHLGFQIFSVIFVG